MISAVDLFCGAGGTSTGILKACDERLQKPINLVAVNHWPVAINTHSLNHPRVKHICESVENLHPLDLVRGGRLELLAASCECRYHSNARGGGPCNEQSRSQAWQLVRWATDIQVENILMENVREFMNWGPLLTKPLRYLGRYYKKDRPDPRRKGEFFRAFVNALGNLGYTVEHRLQCAADYGDPTTRERLILIARRGKSVVWPEPTHGPGRSKPWRAARECIDWSIRGINIFDRERLGLPPLCPNTLRRIAAGIKKFGGEAAEPFLILLNGTSEAHIESSVKSLDEPLPTVVASGNHIALCEPFVIGQQSGGVPRSVNEPLPTVATAGAIRLVEPFIEPIVMKYYRTGRCKSVNGPLDTITTKARFMLVEFEGGPGLVKLGIRTRMLQPHELARCHSFPKTYQFTGSKEDQTKQIGNSVPVELAAAHTEVALN